MTAAAILLTGCGTTVVENEFAVTVDDPSARLGTGPVEISVFDSLMGSSDEWSRKTMGTATGTVPYTTTIASTTTKMIGDGSPVKTITAGLAIPALQPKGYFALDLTPIEGETTTISAPFVGYYDYDPSSGAVAPLPLQITSTANGNSWLIKIRVSIPPAAR